MSQDPQELGAVDLFSPTEAASEEVQEQTHTDENEQTDDLFEDESEDLLDEPEAEEESEEDHSKPKGTKAKERIQKLVGERKALETQLASLSGAAKTVQALYGKYKDPELELRYADSLVTSMFELAKTDVIAKRFLESIHNHATKQETPNFSWVTNKEAKMSDSDPRVDKLLRATASKEVSSVLETGKVRKELRKAISEHVLSSTDLSDLSRDTVKQAVREFCEAQGWDREFVTGTSKAKPPAPSKAAGKGTAARSEKSPDAATAAPKAQSMNEWRDEARKEFQSLFEQSGTN